MVESLVVEFDQAKYKEFLFWLQEPQSDAAIPHGLLRDPLSPRMACANSVISGRIAHVARVNVSHETCGANNDKG